MVYTSDVGSPGGMPADDSPEAIWVTRVGVSAASRPPPPPPPPLYARAASPSPVPPLLRCERRPRSKRCGSRRCSARGHRAVPRRGVAARRPLDQPAGAAGRARAAGAGEADAPRDADDSDHHAEGARILPPNNGAPWANIMATWTASPASRSWSTPPTICRRSCRPPSALAPHVLRMRAAIERDDIATARSLYGGVYADLDTELLSAPLLARAAASGRVLLASERVGAHNSAAPHVIACRRATRFGSRSSPTGRAAHPRCYEPMNTGTMALTAFVNRAVCRDRNHRRACSGGTPSRRR